MGTAVEERPKRAEDAGEAKEAAKEADRTAAGPGAETGEGAAGVPASAPYSGGPVFVDASGRRRRLFRKAGWLVAGSCACYAVVLGGSIVGGTSAAPWLPIPGMVQKAEAAVKQHTLADRAPKESAPKARPETGTPTAGGVAAPLAGASTPGWTGQETTEKVTTGKKDSASADKSSDKAPAKSATGGGKAPTTGDQNPAPDKGSSGHGTDSGSTTPPDESAGGGDDSPATNEPAPPAEQPSADDPAPAPAGNPIGDLLGGVLSLPGKLLGG